MEAERVRIDPALDAVDASFATADQAGLAESMWRLSAGLASHMRHEDNETLPLVEQHLGRVGWAVFTKHMGSNAPSLPPRSFLHCASVVAIWTANTGGEQAPAS
jgi:hypothetical protein